MSPRMVLVGSVLVFAAGLALLAHNPSLAHADSNEGPRIIRALERIADALEHPRCK